MGLLRMTDVKCNCSKAIHTVLEYYKANMFYFKLFSKEKYISRYRYHTYLAFTVLTGLLYWMVQSSHPTLHEGLISHMEG